MTNYVRVKDGKIITQVYDTIPDSFQTFDDQWITGAGKLSKAKLKSNGWVPVIYPNIGYDPIEQDIIYKDVFLSADGLSAVVDYEIVEKPKEDKIFDLQKSALMRAKLKTVGSI